MKSEATLNVYKRNTKHGGKKWRNMFRSIHIRLIRLEPIPPSAKTWNQSCSTDEKSI